MKITKRLGALFPAFFWLGLVSIGTNAQEQMADLVARIRPSVVTVVTYDKYGRKLGRGSGFCVATNQIVTNKHVIEDSFRNEVTTGDGTSFRVVETVGVDDEGDLALLKTDPLPTSAKPLTISKLPPRVGDKIIVIGNPLGLEGTVSDGIVSAFREVRGIGRLIQITAPISPGSSGSPVVNAWGEVVGVATLNLEGGQNLNFAISSERIISLWSSLLITSSIPRTPVSTSLPDGKALTAHQLVARGSEAIKNNDYEGAITFLKEAIRRDGQLATAHHQLGFALYGLKRYGEAVTAYQMAIKLSANSRSQSISIYNLALTYKTLGNRNAAFEQQKLLLIIDPVKAQELLSDLTNIAGYWETSDSDRYKNRYMIIDDGTKVVVKYHHTDNHSVKYEAQWNGDIAIGYIFTENHKSRFVLKAVDFHHIWFRSYRLNLTDPPEKVLKKAIKESKKEPDQIWTKLP